METVRTGQPRFIEQVIFSRRNKALYGGILLERSIETHEAQKKNENLSEKIRKNIFGKALQTQSEYPFDNRRF